jgi:hypothetical protein
MIFVRLHGISYKLPKLYRLFAGKKNNEEISVLLIRL